MSSKKNKLWFPYAQMKNFQNAFEVKKAEGVYLYDEKGNKYIDAIASWWCSIHGYNHPEINNSLKKQVDLFSHVMLGGLTHEPAEKFADKLVEITPEGLNHVFFSDSGSVGVEVALKMAVQYHKNNGVNGKVKFLSLTKSYHGDTFKAMEVGDDMCYHQAFSELFGSRYYVDVNNMGYDADSNIFNKAINQLKKILEEEGKSIAAFIVEPILQAAGGFNVYSPEFLNEAKLLCEKHNVLLIFDEVATGFGRTGDVFGASHCSFTPDIMVLSKGLTSGYIGHAATIATTKVFDAFYSDDPDKAFMHGPTFMGNPLAAVAATKGIELFFRNDYLGKVKQIERILKERVLPLKSEKIKGIRVIGATAAIELFNSNDSNGFQKFAMDKGVWIRPYENFIYTMPAYIMSEDELNKVIDVIIDWFNE